MNPIISLIVPVYKVEKFLPRAIESVQNQTFRDWEMILVDDGSPDRCGEICDRYAAQDRRIRVIHKPNGGVSSARNKGLDALRGEYLCFLDPDDYMLPQAMEVLYNEIVKSQADMVMAGHDRIEADGKIHRDYRDWPIYKETESIQQAFLRNDLPNFVWGKLYKKELWQDIYFPEGITMEDMYIFPSVAFHARKIVILPETLYIYSHENENSIMSGFARSYVRLHFNRWLAWREHERLAEAYWPEATRFCAEKAIHAAVRAIMLNAGQELLHDNEVRQMKTYLAEHRKEPVEIGLKMGSLLIQNNCGMMLNMLGKLQRALAERHQKRRVEKLKKHQGRKDLGE